MNSTADVTDAGLAHLSGLERLASLSLDNTRVTDAGLVHLYGLKNLRSAHLEGAQVTLRGIAELRKALPETDVSY